VAFDPGGKFHRAVTRRFPNIQDPTLAETLALEEAVSLIGDLRLRNTCVIGDALQVVQMARQDVECPVICEAPIGRIQFMLDRNLIAGPFWVPRDQNSVAHVLANFAKSSPLFFNTWDTLPSFLSFVSGRFPEP
jgi:hypothetical protein